MSSKSFTAFFISTNFSDTSDNISVCTVASTPASFTAKTVSASFFVYFTTAGISILFAISTMVKASMFLTPAYCSKRISFLASNSAFERTPNLPYISIVVSSSNDGIASTIDLQFGSPLFSASTVHSSEYPFPLNTILACSFINLAVYSSTALSKSSAPSNAATAFSNCSAIITLRTVFTSPMVLDEATILNSNLLPVKANGDVLFLSVGSFSNLGSFLIPKSISPEERLDVALPFFIICSTTSPT